MIGIALCLLLYNLKPEVSIQKSLQVILPLRASLWGEVNAYNALYT